MSTYIKSRIDIIYRVRNEISQRSSLPDGQLVNEQRVLLINSPRGTTFSVDLIAAGWLEIYCTAEFNYSIILSRRTVTISKIHIQPDQNRRFDHSEYLVAFREFNTRFYSLYIEKSQGNFIAFKKAYLWGFCVTLRNFNAYFTDDSFVGSRSEDRIESCIFICFYYFFLARRVTEILEKLPKTLRLAHIFVPNISFFRLSFTTCASNAMRNQYSTDAYVRSNSMLES